LETPITADAPPIAADKVLPERPPQGEALFTESTAAAKWKITLNSSAAIGGASAVIGVSKAFLSRNFPTRPS
jgi:hypothetical protein